MEYVKWILIAVAAYLGLKWLSGAVSSFSSQQSSQLGASGWGSGMLFAPGSAWTQQSYPYGYPFPTAPLQPTSYAFGGQVPVWGSPAPWLGGPYHNLTADYSPDGGADVGFSW